MTNFEPITMVDKELSSLIVKDKKNIYDLKWQLADSNPHYCSYTDSEIVSMYCMNKKQYIGVLINNNFQNSLITEMQYGQAKKMIPGLSRLGYGQYEYCLSYKSDKFKVYMTDSVIDKMRDENLKLERKRVNDSFLYMKDVILGDKADDIKMSFNFLPHAGTINGVELIDDEKILSYNVNRCFFPISPMEFDNVDKLLEIFVDKNGLFNSVLFNKTTLVAYNNKVISIDVKESPRCFKKIKDKMLKLER